MTNEEAIKLLSQIMDALLASNSWLPSTDNPIKESFGMAINALEKQIPMKPIRIDKNNEFDGNWKKVCPSCKRTLIERITTPETSFPRHYNYSSHCKCGQAIDWEDN